MTTLWVLCEILVLWQFGLGTQWHWCGTQIQPDMSEITAKYQLPFWSQLLYCLLNEEELLLHGLSIAEFEGEMLKKVNPHRSHQTLFSLMFKILIQSLLKSRGTCLLTSVGLDQAVNVCLMAVMFHLDNYLFLYPFSIFQVCFAHSIILHVIYFSLLLLCQWPNHKWDLH